MAQLINISEAASLAIYSTALVAASQLRLNVNQIAAVTGASKNHHAKVLQTLVKFGYLASLRIYIGGFALGRPADEIILYEIYQAIEAPPDASHYGLHASQCPLAACVFGGLTRRFASNFIHYLITTRYQKFLSTNKF